MESTQGRPNIVGIVSMTLVLPVAVSVLIGWIEPSVLLFVLVVTAMALGIVSVIINRNRDHGYGVVGMAVGLVTMVLLLLDISF